MQQLLAVQMSLILAYAAPIRPAFFPRKLPKGNVSPICASVKLQPERFGRLWAVGGGPKAA